MNPQGKGQAATPHCPTCNVADKKAVGSRNAARHLALMRTASVSGLRPAEEKATNKTL